ncbi:hypothetical protein GCK72_011680 [Caenorhabditis remanei]|uniref:Uncharacterized protein n=1 Tax=Caenorhabditis remanei TaxID=31234 RepID=A0A6A5H9C8_CAERE|nr:hypothetical protein GCK72_011680 [Caenorhabditis remanei]KAF1763414.1 hypothetical protein GCK72_011680 [Caenorhabditis remanei]
MLSTKTLVFILVVLLAISTVSSTPSGGNKCGRILMGHIDAICGKDCDESAEFWKLCAQGDAYSEDDIRQICCPTA